MSISSRPGPTLESVRKDPCQGLVWLRDNTESRRNRHLKSLTWDSIKGRAFLGTKTLALRPSSKLSTRTYVFLSFSYPALPRLGSYNVSSRFDTRRKDRPRTNVERYDSKRWKERSHQTFFILGAHVHRGVSETHPFPFTSGIPVDHKDWNFVGV